MSFRRRVILLSGVAVAVAVAAVSIVTYVLVRDELRGRVDDELEHDVDRDLRGPARRASSDPPRLESAGRGPTAATSALQTARPARAVSARPKLLLPVGPARRQSVYAQLVDANGQVTHPSGPRTELGSVDGAREVAAGDREPFFSEIETDGAHLRVYTAQIETRPGDPGRAAARRGRLDT